MSLKKVTSEILEKVHQIQRKHPGGPEFFDALDAEIIESASKEMIAALFSLAPKKNFIVLSGGFGKKIAAMMDNGELPQLPYHLYAGGIRSGKKPELLRSENFGKPDYTSGIFLDDSIYGGATYYAIQKEFTGRQKLYKCAVIYDGCPIKKEDIKAVFRYYDHFNATPNYKF